MQSPFNTSFPGHSLRKKRPVILAVYCYSNRRLTQVFWRLVSVAICCTFCGCIVGPDYRRPRPPVPEQWNQRAQPGIAPGPGDQARWWRLFADPVLEGLVARTLRANLNLREAYYRILEARAKRCVVSGDLFPVALFDNETIIAIPLPSGVDVDAGTVVKGQTYTIDPTTQANTITATTTSGIATVVGFPSDDQSFNPDIGDDVEGGDVYASFAQAVLDARAS